MDENQLNTRFEELYEKNLAPRIVPLEQERSVIAKVSNRNNIIGVLCFLSSVIGLWLLSNAYFLILLLPAIIIFLIESKRQNKFRLKIKQQLLMEIFALFGKFQYCPDNELITKNEIFKTGLFPRFKCKKDNDQIVGNYKGMDIIILETKLTHNETIQNRDSSENKTVEDFNGLIIKTTLKNHIMAKLFYIKKQLDKKGKNRQLNQCYQKAWEMKKLIKSQIQIL